MTVPAPVMAASRCTARPSGWTAPRSVLPSTGTAAISPPAGTVPVAGAAASRSSSAPASAPASAGRIVVSLGTARAPPQGSVRTPRQSSAVSGAAAAHSAIATSDFAPAATAAQARPRIEVRLCRRPCARRGSGTPARNSGSLGTVARSSPSPADRTRTAAPESPAEDMTNWPGIGASSGQGWFAPPDLARPRAPFHRDMPDSPDRDFTPQPAADPERSQLISHCENAGALVPDHLRIEQPGAGHCPGQLCGCRRFPGAERSIEPDDHLTSITVRGGQLRTYLSGGIPACGVLRVSDSLAEGYA